MIKKIKMSDIPEFTIEMIDFAKFLEEDNHKKLINLDYTLDLLPYWSPSVIDYRYLNFINKFARLPVSSKNRYEITCLNNYDALEYQLYHNVDFGSNYGLDYPIYFEEEVYPYPTGYPTLTLKEFIAQTDIIFKKIKFQSQYCKKLNTLDYKIKRKDLYYGISINYDLISKEEYFAKIKEFNDEYLHCLASV